MNIKKSSLVVVWKRSDQISPNSLHWGSFWYAASKLSFWSCYIPRGNTFLVQSLSCAAYPQLSPGKIEINLMKFIQDVVWAQRRVRLKPKYFLLHGVHVSITFLKNSNSGVVVSVCIKFLLGVSPSSLGDLKLLLIVFEVDNPSF
uniref:Uncharacterized protein n=1 Tax=Glossina pallidipes TaxID=7398 RepID=A0A1A9ZDV0_GLOPL